MTTPAKEEAMTVEEFLMQQADLVCRACRLRGVLRYERNYNNNALQVVCPCGSRSPLATVTNLKQNTRRQRKDYPMGESPDEVWAKWGQRCFFCTMPRELLERMGIGRSVHHVNPYSEEQQHRGPTVPLCVSCHAIANERQRLYWFIQRTLAHVDVESVPPGRLGVSRPGLPPDPVSAQEQEPAGVLEGFSDDDADD